VKSKSPSWGPQRTNRLCERQRTLTKKKELERTYRCCPSQTHHRRYVSTCHRQIRACPRVQCSCSRQRIGAHLLCERSAMLANLCWCFPRMFARVYSTRLTLVHNTGVKLDCHWCADNLAEETRRVAGIVCCRSGGGGGAVGGRCGHFMGLSLAVCV